MADPQPLSSRHALLLERHGLLSSSRHRAAGLSTTTIDVKEALVSDVMISPSSDTNNNKKSKKNAKNKKQSILARNVSLARIQQELKELERDPPHGCSWAGLRDPTTFKRHRSLLDQDVATASGATNTMNTNIWPGWNPIIIGKPWSVVRRVRRTKEGFSF